MFDMEVVATIHKYILEIKYMIHIQNHILCESYMFEGGGNHPQIYIKNT